VYVIVVDFTIKPGHVATFHAAMIENARLSREIEPGCRQFDVCVDPKDATRIFLYELYDDEAAFQAHLKTAHFLDFDRASAPWVAAKSARALARAAP
jgi:(4S)-4-hydroxy-5-phosphonooxypentane-2,3-dione isomerase